MAAPLMLKIFITFSSQARANLAILEVKQAAMEEIRAARGASRPAPEEAKEGGQVNIYIFSALFFGPFFSG